MKQFTNGLASMMAICVASCLGLTIFFPLALYACWLWKCLVAIYPKL